MITTVSLVNICHHNIVTYIVVFFNIREKNGKANVIQRE